MKKVNIFSLFLIIFVAFLPAISIAEDPASKLSSEKDCKLAAKAIVEGFIIAPKYAGKQEQAEKVFVELKGIDYIKNDPVFFSDTMTMMLTKIGVDFWRHNKDENLLESYPRKTLETWQFEALYKK